MLSPISDGDPEEGSDGLLADGDHTDIEVLANRVLDGGVIDA